MSRKISCRQDLNADEVKVVLGMARKLNGHACTKKNLKAISLRLKRRDGADIAKVEHAVLVDLITRSRRRKASKLLSTHTRSRHRAPYVHA